MINFLFSINNLDEFWICYGDHCKATIIQGSLRTGKMNELELNSNIDSKIVSIVYVNEFNMVIMALLCGYLIGFDIETKAILWRIKLSDSIMCMVAHKHDEIKKLYCGLSNGKLAILEVIYTFFVLN